MTYVESFGDETVAESIRNNKFEERAKWLEEHGYNGGDIMTDEYGREYVISIDENGTAGEDGYSVDSNRMYLPDELQND